MTQENTTNKNEVPTDVSRENLARLLEIEKQIQSLEAEQHIMANSLGTSALVCPIDKLETFIEEISELGFSRDYFVSDVTHRIYELRLQAETEAQAEVISRAVKGGKRFEVRMIENSEANFFVIYDTLTESEPANLPHYENREDANAACEIMNNDQTVEA